ncbi:GtrA family protein [Paenibacillus sp. P26]|nr:GtrA family protein [Paenibacillus sp. P26]UUZ90813.1 GtrA family protein [Paenibacillus sp. P25]
MKINKILKNQIFLFILVGCANTLVGYSIYAICLLFFEINYILSLFISHIVGVLNSYILNRLLTFKEFNGNTFHSISKFISVYVITFLVNLSVLFFLVHIMNFDKVISQVVALFLTTCISFVGHKFWSFKTNKTERGL